MRASGGATANQNWLGCYLSNVELARWGQSCLCLPGRPATDLVPSYSSVQVFKDDTSEILWFKVEKILWIRDN